MHIFISHAAANARLARILADLLESFGATTFLASRAGDIRADENWVTGIERALQQADGYIILLTPESTLRPWVNFETGAAWFSGKQLLFVRIQTLDLEDIPFPITSRQIYALDKTEELEAVIDTLGLPKRDLKEFVNRFLTEADEFAPVGENEPVWESVQIQNVYYAWAGPLLNLQDREAIPPPAGLIEEIQRRGLSPRWGMPHNLADHFQRGLAQVFATDRKSWRRPIMDKRRFLLVR